MPGHIPSTFSRHKSTWIRCVSGTVGVHPLEGGERFRVSASGHRSEIAEPRDLTYLVREYVNALGGLVPYMRGPNPSDYPGYRFERAGTVVNKLLESDVDAPPDNQALMRMARPSTCTEPCGHCGTACSVDHTLVSLDFHRCKDCATNLDLKHILEKPLQEADDPEMARIRKRVGKAKADRLAQDPATQALDNPEMMVKHEVAKRSEPIKKLAVYGRRWYRRGAGGVYCKAYIYINDKLVHVTPEQYGYGDHYLTLAKDWLKRNGYLEGLLDDDREPLWYLRDKHGIELFYTVTDVKRERDL